MPPPLFKHEDWTHNYHSVHVWRWRGDVLVLVHNNKSHKVLLFGDSILWRTVLCCLQWLAVPDIWRHCRRRDTVLALRALSVNCVRREALLITPLCVCPISTTISCSGLMHCGSVFWRPLFPAPSVENSLYPASDDQWTRQMLLCRWI